MSPDAQGTSTRPYLIRALHDWCTDNGFTPYLAVHVAGAVQVPMEYVKNQEIVLNVGFEATSGLQLGNEFIEFKARFGGVARDIVVPVDHVVAIYARENGQGMAFPAPQAGSGQGATESPQGDPALSQQQQKPAAPVLSLSRSEAALAGSSTTRPDKSGDEPPKPRPGGRPALKRVK